MDTLESLEIELARYWAVREKNMTQMTYAIEITKDGSSKTYGFHKLTDAEKFMRHARRDGYEARFMSRQLIEVLTELMGL